MPTIETLQPGKNLGAKALLATALMDAGVSVRKASKASGISHGTASKLTPTKRKDKTLEYIDPEQVRKVRTNFQDRCLLLSDGLLGTNLYSKAGKAGLGETVQAAYKLAELAGIKQPDRTEHFHAVMLKFSLEQPVVNAVDPGKDQVVLDVHSQDVSNAAECKD